MCWWMGDAIDSAMIGAMSESALSSTAETPTMPVSLISTWMVPSR